MFQVFCGPFQPSLETAFLKRLEDLSPGPGRTISVVTPSKELSSRLQRLLTVENNRTFLNVRFHTFYTLALDVLSAGGRSFGTVLTDDFFLDKLIDGLLRDHFASRHENLSRRLSSAFRETLRDLEEAGVDPDQFLEFHFEELVRDENDRARLKELLHLQKRLSARLKELDLLPFHALARRASQSLRENPSGKFPYAEVLYYGFYDLTGVQADFFQSVGEVCPVSVFFPYRHGHPAFSFSERFYKLKLHQGGVAPEHLAPGAASRAVGGALDGLFAPDKAGVRPKADAFHIISASGARDEIWRVAKEILRLREDPSNPVPYSQIGVTARSLEPYRAAVEDVFRENGIPFHLAASEPLLRHPIAKTALALLTLRRRDVPARALLDLAESPYLNFSRAQKVPAETRALVERLGIHSGWIQWQGKLAACAEGKVPSALSAGDARDLTASAVVLWPWLSGLHERLDPTRRFENWRGLVSHAMEILREYLAPPHDGVEGKAWAKTVASLESLALFDALNEPPGWTSFLEALEERLERASLEPERMGQGVRVASVMDARGDSFKVLFLVGLQEGLFPRSSHEDPLLRDGLRALMQQPAGYWISQKLAGYDEEKTLFYLTLSSASDKLYAVYSRSGDDGRAQVPSLYLRELVRAAGYDFSEELTSERSEAAGRLVDWVPRSPYAKLADVPADFLSPGEAVLNAARFGSDASPLLRAMGQEPGALNELLVRADTLNQWEEPGPRDGIIGKNAAFAERLARSGLSPKALDQFAACPFQFFLARVVNLGEEKDATERDEMAAWIKGNFYHKVLELFYRDLQSADFWNQAALDHGKWRPSFERAMAAAFREFTGESLGLYPLLWESLKGNLEANLRRFIEADIRDAVESGMVPTHFEKEISAVVPSEPPVVLKGRMDRVDVSADGRMRVVDYKSKLKFSNLEKAVAKGDERQPPAYLEILARAGRPWPGEDKFAGVLYREIEPPEGESLPRTATLDAESWRALRKSFLSQTAFFRDEMEKGLFPIRPSDTEHGHCGYCSFAAVCRKSHGPTRWRADNSAVRASHEDKLGLVSERVDEKPAKGGSPKTKPARAKEKKP